MRINISSVDRSFTVRSMSNMESQVSTDNSALQTKADILRNCLKTFKQRIQKF